MGNKIGVLGSNVATVLGAATVYLCPVAKAAKFKVFFLGQAGAGGVSTLQILVNNITIMQSAAMAASNFVFSPRGAGIIVAPQAALPTGLTVATTPAPADQVYELSAGQSLTYVIGGAAFLSMNMQAIGTEIDV